MREPIGLHHLQLTRGGGGGHGGGGHSGGGGFSGGGGGFHSYSGGGGYGTSGGGSLIGFLFSAFFLLLLLFIIFRVVRAMSKGGASAPGAGGSGLPMVPRPRGAGNPGTAKAVAALRADDPDFEGETFLQRAEMTYFLVNRAYQHRDAAGMQPYLAPELFATRSQAVQALIEAHQQPAQIDLNVRGIHVPSVQHGADGDRIMVHFDLVSRNRVVDDRTGKIVSDPGDDVRSGEQWLFCRKAGAKTVTSGGVVAAKCPVCGAPLQLDLEGACAHCKSPVTSGAHDWVVTSIQPAGFAGAQPDDFLGAQRLGGEQGLAAIATEDPAFQRDAFLERTASAFNALQAAWQARDLTDARGFMSPGLYYAWQAQVEQLQEQHRKNVLEGLRIIGIVPVAVMHSPAFDDVTVRVEASCADYEIDDTTNKIVYGDRRPESFSEFWTFQRGVDVKTSGKQGTLEKQCPNCGAPLKVNAVGECTYCKAAVTSGKFDWVLSRIEQPEDVAI